MGKGAPAAPNPTDTASAQQSANLINQYSPFGSSVYTQTGTGPTGVPTYRQDTTLSTQAQGALDASLGAQTNIANTAKELSGKLSGQLGKPLDWSAQQTYLNDLTAQNLNPQWDRLDQQNQTDLTNRGIRPGSDVYGEQRDDFLKSRSGAFNSANLGNYNSALQSQMALRNQPLNELTGLLGASQVQTPQFGSTPFTDVAGIAQQGYQNQMGQYNAGQQQLGGLFSAGASLIPLLSDRRAKRDIKRIGKLDNGLAVFSYRYKHGGPVQIGLMAQDVEQVFPDAVSTHESGYKMVDYSKATRAA